jgi:excisionase family DNA binding protein
MDRALARETYTVPEAGTVLGIGRSAAYGAAARGELPVVKIGKRLLVPRAALDRLLNGDGELVHRD